MARSSVVDMTVAVLLFATVWPEPVASLLTRISIHFGLRCILSPFCSSRHDFLPRPWNQAVRRPEDRCTNLRQMNEAPAGESSLHKRAGSGSIEPSNSKKQRPLSVTCNNCREKKVKCSGQNPCSGCQRSGSSCIFRERLKPGLKVGTGESAMSRLQELQIRLEALEDWRLQVELGKALHSAPLLDQSDDVQPHALPGLLDVRSGTHISGSPDQWRASLPVPATSGDTDACHFDSTGFGDAGSAFYDHDQAGPSLSHPCPPPGVPPDKVVHSLIALYFQHIAPWAPILHISQANTWQSPWPIFVHAMIAVSVRFSSDPDVRACSEKWRHEARKHVILKAAETTDIGSLQALSILVLDVIGSGSNPETWGLLALLTRSAIHLGLSKDERSMGNHEQTKLFCILARPVSFIEDESRRRLFFMIYMLDRHACAATGWDFAIPDHETHCRLPCRDSLWISADAVETPYFESSLHSLETLDDAMCDRLSPLAYQIQLVDLLGRVHALQAQKVNIESPREFDAFKDQARTLSAAVKRCYTSIPDRVLNPSATTDAPPNTLSCILSATYYATLLKLSARFAYPSRPSIVDAFMSMSCKEGISGMAKLARNITRHKQTAYVSPFFVWCIWVAGRVAFIHSYTMREAPSDDLTSMIQCLKDCSLTWESAGHYAHLLEKALMRWQKQDPLTMFSQGGAFTQAIAVLLDTTKTAYSAVAQDTVTPAEPAETAESRFWAVQPELEELHQWFNMPSLESLLTG